MKSESPSKAITYQRNNILENLFSPNCSMQKRHHYNECLHSAWPEKMY